MELWGDSLCPFMWKCKYSSFIPRFLFMYIFDITVHNYDCFIEVTIFSLRNIKSDTFFSFPLMMNIYQPYSRK